MASRTLLRTWATPRASSARSSLPETSRSRQVQISCSLSTSSSNHSRIKALISYFLSMSIIWGFLFASGKRAWCPYLYLAAQPLQCFCSNWKSLRKTWAIWSTSPVWRWAYARPDNTLKPLIQHLLPTAPADGEPCCHHVCGIIIHSALLRINIKSLLRGFIVIAFSVIATDFH